MLNDTANAKYVQTITIKNKNSWVMKYTFTSTVAQGLGTFDAVRTLVVPSPTPLI